jgi:hypothetical protein
MGMRSLPIPKQALPGTSRCTTICGMKLTPLVTTILLLLCFSTQAQTVLPDDGHVTDGMYVNLFFGLGFRCPEGWVVQDEAVTQRIRERAKEEAAKTGGTAQLKDTYLLLTVSRYPRGEQTGALNPMILVVAEKMTGMSESATGKDYLFDLRPEKQKRGGKPLLKEPVETKIAGLRFFRDDYGGEVNGISMRQSIFATAKKGYALLFSFTGEDQKSLDEMVKAMETVLPLGMGPGDVRRRTP